ncbi:MAG: tetratricopeptide repeat protein [Candidatus Omnitrophica bacterium]|nr:tetratricopeptide repeat protein [Candidatus Omnitrophota bacterium]
MKNKNIITILVFNLVICLLIGFPLQAQETISSDATVKDSNSKEVEQIDFANGLLQRGFYDMAVKEYEKYIQTFPESPYLNESFFGVGEAHFFAEDFQAAMDGYQRFIELYPDNKKKLVAELRIGQAFYSLQKYDEALAKLLSVPAQQLEGEFPQILFLYIGKTYRAKKDQTKSKEFLEKAANLENKKNASYAFIEMAEMFAEDKNFGEAKIYFEKAAAIAEDVSLKALSLFKEGEMAFILKDYKGSADIFRMYLKEYKKENLASEALANLVLALYNTAQYQELLNVFEEYKFLIKNDKTFFDVHYAKANAHAQLNIFDAATKDLDEVLAFAELTPQQYDKALLRKLEILLKAKKFEEILKIDPALLKQAQENQDHFQFLLAEANYGLGQNDQAFELYNKVIQGSKDSEYYSEALYGMAHAQNSKGDGQKAFDLFVQFSKDGKNTVKQIEALYNAIIIGIKLEKFQETIPLCEEYLSMPDDNMQKENVLFYVSTLYQKVNQFDKSFQRLNQFIEKYPQSPKYQEALFLLGYNLQSMERYDEAIERYKKILENKNDTKLYYSALKNTALIHMKRKEEEAAAKIFDELVTQFNENDLEVETYVWIAEEYLAKQRYEDVLRILKDAVLRDDSAQEIDKIAFFKAEAFRGTENYDKALEYYDNVLSILERDTYAGASHIGKGLCLIEKNKLDEAKAEFEAALLDHADDATITMRARFELGNIEKLKNNLEEAAKFYMVVAVLYEDSFYCPESLYRAGMIFEQLQKKDEALKVYEEITKRYQHSHVFEKAQQRLRENNAT